MSIFHHHQWVDEDKTFNPPIPVKRFSDMDYGFAMRLLYGVTNVTQRCSECGEVAFRQTTGKA